MEMKVEIYSTNLRGINSYVRDRNEVIEEQRPLLAKLRDDVNESLSKHPNAKVKWLQDVASSGNGGFIQITAIVSYPSKPVK